MRKSDGVEITANDQGNRRIHEKGSYVDVRKNDGFEITANDQGNRRIHEKGSCIDVRKNHGVEITAKYRGNSRCHDADVTPIVRDPLDDDSIPVESRAEIIPVPPEPSESEKMKHELTHIPFQPWCTSCVEGKAQAEPHKRTERIIEDSELPVVQRDYLVLKDVAEHVRENIRIRHVHSCRNERRNRRVRGSVGSENVELPWTL